MGPGFASLTLALVFCFGCTPGSHIDTGNRAAVTEGRESGATPAVRSFRPFLGERWIGDAISYGPFRDGQRPGGIEPSEAEVREDLAILSRHWSLLRVYGSRGPAETMLRVIREDELDMRVMLGVWIDREARRDESGAVIETFEEAARANRAEVEAGIRLANEYSDIVIAVSVGNETQVFWSAHRSDPGMVIGYLREVREAVEAPVTTADDFMFWKEPESRAMAREVDFITMHVHPMWTGEQLEGALAKIRSEYE
ncbi:MAG: hypothetical protein HKN20_14035, partial [Gemmatimonadetes bacterium]|nr:hypothetical protein [Gemmatimonadota bacterium]